MNRNDRVLIMHGTYSKTYGRVAHAHPSLPIVCVTPDEDPNCEIAYKLNDVRVQAQPKTLAELREISLRADEFANLMSDQLDIAAESCEREATQRYNQARGNAHEAFRAYVDHPDYLLGMYQESTTC